MYPDFQKGDILFFYSNIAKTLIIFTRKKRRLNADKA